MSNKRRHAQAFPLAATLIGVAIAVCIAVFAIKALTVKYQLIQGGEKLKRLERELTSVSVKNEAFQTQKDLLISPPNLAKALEKGVINDLEKIDEKYVINVGRPPRAQVVKLAAAPGEER
jgi:cell division protein FtsL